jgi:hypothetical protein
MKKNSSHCSDTIQPNELPRMVNPFARWIRDVDPRFQKSQGSTAMNCASVLKELPIVLRLLRVHEKF